MRDQIDAVIWNDGHEDFSRDLTRRAAKVRAAFRSIPTPLKAMAAALAASITTLASTSPPAAAQPFSAPLGAVEVSFADLDLGSSDGQRALDARLRSAARIVCEPPALSVSAAPRQREACVSVALGDARRQVHQVLASRGSSRLASASYVSVAAH